MQRIIQTLPRNQVRPHGTKMIYNKINHIEIVNNIFKCDWLFSCFFFKSCENKFTTSFLMFTISKNLQKLKALQDPLLR